MPPPFETGENGNWKGMCAAGGRVGTKKMTYKDATVELENTSVYFGFR